jgi:hypothetical protein
LPDGSSGGAPPDVERRDDQTGDPRTARRRTPEQRKRIKGKRQELRQKKQELRKIRNKALAANAAHDRRTTIGSMTSSAQTSGGEGFPRIL